MVLPFAGGCRRIEGNGNARTLLSTGLILALPVLASAVRAEAPRDASRLDQPSKPASLAGVRMAEAVSATTGMAISPLLGVSAVGAWRYWQTPRGGPAAMSPGTPARGSGGRRFWLSCCWL